MACLLPGRSQGQSTSCSDPSAWSWDREKPCCVQAPAAAVVRSLGWGERKAKVAEKLLQTGHMPYVSVELSGPCPLMCFERSTKPMRLRVQDCGHLCIQGFQDWQNPHPQGAPRSSSILKTPLRSPEYGKAQDPCRRKQ